MSIGSSTKFVTFILFLISSIVTQAAEWQTDNHQILIGDFNADSQLDIRIQPIGTQQAVTIPYDIELNITLVPEFQETVLVNTGTDFSLNYTPAENEISAVTWSANNDFTRHFGDFNGDGLQDLLLQPHTSGTAGVVILGFNNLGTPSLWGQLSLASQGVDISTETVNLSIEDLDQDGIDDVKLQNKQDLSESVIYSKQGVELTNAFEYPLCQVNDLTDTDCDGLADRFDIDRYNPNNNSSTEQALTDSPVDAIDGRFTVTRNGKAAYSIPLALIPGNASPSLSLSYDQQAGNGIMGMGWFINGLSEISRCPTTLAQDGYINGVNFNSSDRFCLNGQRLVQVASNEYRTENESFTKVTSSGTSGNGPASFTVWKHNGEIETYGGTANARQATQSGGHILTWAISRSEDREGNYAAYNYHNNTSLGEFWISRVDYNGNTNASQAADRSITFDYENRTDATPLFSNSTLTTYSQRLKTITTLLGTQTVRSYTLDYTSGQNSRSLIADIEECLDNGVCLPETQFTWDLGSSNESDLAIRESAATDTSFQAASYTNQQYHLSDVNADGKADVTWTYRDGNHLGIVLFLAKADGSGFTKQSAIEEQGYFASVIDDRDQKILMGDMNGDGKSDLVWVARKSGTLFKTIYLANASGTGFVSQGYEVDTDPDYINAEESQYLLADVNGDQLQDLVWSYHFNNKLAINTYVTQINASNQVYLGQVSKYSDDSISPALYQNKQFATGDVNGDGKTDLVWSFRVQNSLYRMLFLANANGSGFTKISLEKDDFVTSSDLHQIHLSDLNSDGKADLIWTYRNVDNHLTRVTYQSNRLGNHFIKRATEIDSSYSLINHTSNQTRLTDLNGDDRLDLIYTYIDNTNFGWVSYLSNPNGISFSRHQMGSQSTNSGTSNHQYNFADITGDGKSDLVWNFNTSSGDLKRYTFIQSESYPDHIDRINNGFGNEIRIQYRYLANSGIYTQGANVNYPLRNDAGLSYVVSSYEESNGIGGFNRWSYQYKGARTHLAGRGFLGFEQRIVTDHQRDFVTTENYHQSYPFTGDLSSSRVTHSGLTIEQTYKDWRQVSLNGGKNLHRYLNRQANVKYNLEDGNQVYASVLANTYDHSYGNVTKTITTTGRGYSNYSISGIEQTVTSDYNYDNNPSSWRLGFVVDESKRYQVTGESDRVVQNTYSPLNSNSFLKQSETMFAGSDIEQTRNYLYDDFGNTLSVTLTGKDIDSSNITPQVNTVNQYLSGLYPDISANPESHQQKRLFDERYGTLEDLRDANQLYTNTIYDGFNHQLFSRATDGTETLSSYALCGACPSEAVNAFYSITQTVSHGQSTLPGAPEQTRYFDIKDREVAVKTQHDDGRTLWTQTRYDALGRIIKQSQPFLEGDPVYWIDTAYDELDRPILVQQPDGGSTATQYRSDATYGRKATITATVKVPGNADKVLTTQVFSNGLGQMLRSIDAHNTETDFSYDAQGNLRLTRVNSNTDTDIAITTDISGNRTQLLDPDTGLINYEFDSIGRERRRTYGSGAQAQTTTSSYDRLDRLVSRVDFDGTTSTTASWTYDPTNGIGYVAQESADDFDKSYTYDAFARVKQASTSLFNESQPKTTTYSYDAYSRPQETFYPSGVSIVNIYNQYGYITEIQDNDNGDIYWQALARDAFGNVVEERFANGVATERDFDQTMGRINSIKTGPNIGTNTFQDLAYLHDSAGNLIQRASNRASSEGLVERFIYDDLHRVTQATTTGLVSGTRVTNFAYDALGNIVTKSDISDNNGYQYGGNGGGVHAVSRVEQGTTTTDYHYDSKGNMTRRGQQILSYSVFNKPTSITGPVGNSQLKYGPNRNRFYQSAEKNGETTETRYYDPAYEIAVRDRQIRERTTIGDFLVISTIRNIGSPSVAEDLDYLHRDHLGSVEAITDRFGDYTGRYSFDAWGKRQQDNWQATNVAYDDAISQRVFESTTRSFTGHEYLDSVELIHMNGRVYDPVIGRFLSPDDYVQLPENSQSYNRYSYVLNNPLSYTDPSGELIWFVAIAAVKAYDIYSTIDDVHTTVTDDNLSTAEKTGLLAVGLAASVVPGKAIFKKAKQAWKKKNKKPETDNIESGNQQSQKGSGSDKQTESKKENSVENEKGLATDPKMTAKEIKNARQRGVNRAKSAERELVKNGHPGTADDGGWTIPERKRIAETGQYPKDVRWHHINDVKRNPGAAEIPDNVVPSRGGNSGHVRKYHPEGTRAGSSGKKLNRQKLLKKHTNGNAE